MRNFNNMKHLRVMDSNLHVEIVGFQTYLSKSKKTSSCFAFGAMLRGVKHA